MQQFTPTPTQAASRFAKENPAFEGLLVVTGYTMAGKGRHMRTNQYRFVVKAGQFTRQTSVQKLRRNGKCAGCGKVFLDAELNFIFRPGGIGAVYNLCPACQADQAITSPKFDRYQMDAHINITSEQAQVGLAVAQFTRHLLAAAKKEA